MQEARKWLFRPNFFSLSKWAQFLHVILDLTGKRCPVIFLLFCFSFSRTSIGGKCALHWFYCLEKQKLSLERTPLGKKLRFCIRYLWKMNEKPANLNRGVCFSMKWKATCRNWAHLDEEKQFGLKSHLRASCTQPFNYWQVPWNEDPKQAAVGIRCELFIRALHRLNGLCLCNWFSFWLMAHGSWLKYATAYFNPCLFSSDMYKQPYCVICP